MWFTFGSCWALGQEGLEESIDLQRPSLSYQRRSFIDNGQRDSLQYGDHFPVMNTEMVSKTVVTCNDGNRDCLKNSNISLVMDTDIFQTRLFSVD